MNKIAEIVLGTNPVATYLGCPINLTRRQNEVLLLLSESLSNKEISRRLGISASTVKSHVRDVLGRLNASTRLEAVVLGLRLGLLLLQSEPAPLRPAERLFARGGQVNALIALAA